MSGLDYPGPGGSMELMRVWRSMPPLVYEQAELLRAEMTDVLERQGITATEETNRECLLFILWSVHVGLMNARSGVLRHVLLWLHRRRVRKEARADNARLLDL